MSNFSISFDNPLYLLILIPTFILAFLPYFRLNKQHRKTRNRITSMVLHLVTLTLVVLVLSGFTVHQDEVIIKNQVFIVVDHSKSSDSNRTLINQKVEEVLDIIESDYQVGIITFGNRPYLAAGLSYNKSSVLNAYYSNSHPIEPSGTNIEKALEFAHDNLSDKSSGRIILISDGRETDGTALKSAYDLASQGTKIDVIYISSEQKREEVQITEVKVPDFVQKGIPINIMVSVESRESGNAIIKIYDNDELIDDQQGYNVTLNGALDVFSFEHSFFKSGVHEIRVEIEREGDLIKENNVYYTFANVDGQSNRVLIIDGTGNESQELHQLIENDFQTDVLMIEDLASNMDIIKAYDGIILMNVANSDLPVTFDSKLKYYVEYLGGSLLNIGGHKAYQQSDMEGTIFEGILPVFANTDAKSMAVILVIDKSGSMVTHGSLRLELAKQGAIDSVNALKDNDYVGIVIFDANPVLLVEPMPVTRKDEVIAAIRTIEAGKGTMYTGGIQLAKNQLDNFPGNANFNKHVIFLTDGYPQDTGYMEVIQQYGNISLTTIALGEDHGITDAYAIVESMVRVVEGRGQYYQVSTESELPTIMQDEALSISSGFLNEGNFEPSIYTRIPSVASIVSLPELKGYYGARLKENATLVLTKDSDPIYAEWDYGNGQVGSFMSDLSGKWSNEYFSDPRGHIFIKGIINGLLPEEIINSYDVHARFNKDNFETGVSITSISNDNESLIMEVTNPLGEVNKVDLVRQTTSTLTSRFETSIPGIYTVEITKFDQFGSIISKHTTYTAFSYSKEYDGFYNDSEVFDHMKNIAETGDGDILFSLDNIFSEEAQTEHVKSDPKTVFFIIALVLFLVDIITRKFKFKWPHEWFKKEI